MSRRNSDGPNTAHQQSVNTILKSSRAAWQAVTQLQAEDGLNPDGVFVDGRRGQQHPQKTAHAHLMGYHSQMANKTYWIAASDLWQAELELEDGDTYEVEVPAKSEIHVDENGVSMQDIQTKTETISLETLSHRWSMRYVTVHREEKSSWGANEVVTEQRRVWLPPRALLLAYNQLEEVRAKVNLGADVEAPGWTATKVLDPTEGVREPYQDQEGGPNE